MQSIPNTPDGLPSNSYLWKLPSRVTQPRVAALRVAFPRGFMPHVEPPTGRRIADHEPPRRQPIKTTATKY